VEARRPARLTAVLACGTVLLGACSVGTKSASGKHHKTPAPAARISITPTDRAAGQVSPLTPVVVRAEHGTLDSVRLTGPQGGQVRGNFSPDRTTWTSAAPLAYGRTYTVNATGHNKENAQVTQTGTLTTVKPRAVNSATLFPSSNQGTVGVGQPIDIRFDSPVQNRAEAERSLVVKTTPQTEGSWHWISDTEVRWRPKEYWKPGTAVTVTANLFGRKLGNGVYGEKNVSSGFRVHDSWIAVGDTNTYRLAIYHNGVKVEDFPASFGSQQYPTHDGVHVVEEKYDLFLMNSASWGLPASAPGGYSNFPAYWASRVSEDGEFVHANDGTAGVQGYANVTHGCINLTTERAKWFYDHFNTGDIVKIVGGTPLLPVDDGYGDWNMPWDQYVKGSALR
jgi:lipoprotein-anchoring transpeptidase ErfK/SrfK